MDTKKKTSWKSQALIIVFAFAIFGAGAYTGLALSTKASIPTYTIGGTSSAPIEGAELAEFWRVWRLMDEKFVFASTTAEKPSTQDRINGAISGMVGTFGDDYSIYMPAEESEEFMQEMSGEFSGVGMEVGLRDGVITVISPIEGTPAKRAGMRAQDALLKIDGTSTEGMSVDAAVKLIRGPKGTSVTLQVYRKESGEPFDVTITRDTIELPTVKTEVKGDVFVVHLYTFNQVAYAKFVDAMREYVASGKSKMVLDLRGNPGGYLESAVAIGSLFLKEGDIVLRERVGNEGQEVLHRANGTSLGAQAPKQMVVLIDGGSASASEILAGALQEHGVATLMGTQSFGKGTVQEVVDMPSKASLKVTIARWFTPEGNGIHKLGLTPSVIATTSAEALLAEKDLQLEAALQYLK
ncbi:hypothetical protein A3C89_01865 [Candidatus Kaiserbacteria bacterium RIFCSPHIGHO2_02_FULL_50_50]|uniref:PDZ domain-containing protein n=1 Tax=Candidatus Kaiserbacteria bacterium RIFCSPHIGHO2_02_FULL_50_50 TaxID=1798492 RepID=A0A1F6DCG0_9BACT|nr:MAG: hypothetical protein A3C89_01865 [Candidatus Kaiserbacteria bacterium RIFCSPHIGHO2_02_FULL_50_50]OGG89018.1 MAG: hypothetical protein A3G62_04270 [Candidatus Kaiserbacteria bacterium RIFCSPLOWO2_12_FULL_50_10]